MSCTVLIFTGFLSASAGEVEWLQQVLQGSCGDFVGVGPGHVIDHCHHLLLNVNRAGACRVGQKTREKFVGYVGLTIRAGDWAEICCCGRTQQKCFFWAAHLKQICINKWLLCLCLIFEIFTLYGTEDLAKMIDNDREHVLMVVWRC